MPVKGAESLWAGRMPQPVRVQAMLANILWDEGQIIFQYLPPRSVHQPEKPCRNSGETPYILFAIQSAKKIDSALCQFCNCY
jgi:hypothetical protein